MERPSKKRRPIWSILGVAVLVAAIALVAAALIDPELAAPAPEPAEPLSATATNVSPLTSPDTSASETSPNSVPIAARVNGYTITQSYLNKTIKLNTVLGRLSGADVFGERDTLERLIRSQLILQGATDIDEPTDEDVEAFMGNLQESWGVTYETLVQELEAVDVEPSFLEETIERLLTVQAAVESLQSEGINVSEWLLEQEEDAEIFIAEDLAQTDEAESPVPTPDELSAVPEVAPDFTLRRAGGGTLTLKNQLEEGPVVLVFFEKCG